VTDWPWQLLMLFGLVLVVALVNRKSLTAWLGRILRRRSRNP